MDDDGEMKIQGQWEIRKIHKEAIQAAIARKEAEYIIRISLNELRGLDDNSD
jgi:hypothetical protein